MAVCVSLLLCACTSSKQIPPTFVPVAQECLKSRPVQPTMKFDLLPAAKNEAESAEQVRILWQDRQLLLNYYTEWDVAAAGCQVIK